MIDAYKDPAVDTQSVNYIKDNNNLILVNRVTDGQSVSITTELVTDPGVRSILLTESAPVVWNTQLQFDNWFVKYRDLNQVKTVPGTT